MVAVGDAILVRWVVDLSGTKTEPVGLYDFSFGMRCPDSVTPSWRPDFKRRHSGRWNVLFLDGHVITMRARDLFGYRLDDVRRAWNNDHRAHREFPPVTHPEPGNDPHDF
jgi:prepilin-type processing-associated H-X9-DG protein